MKHRQQGVALIFVLLIFVMVTVMASRIVTDLHFNVEKTARQLQYLQVKHYAFAAENFVAMLLEEDAQHDKKTGKIMDHWFEPWADDKQALETEDGEITIMVVDDQGRFNLNLLSGSQSAGNPNGQEQSRQRQSGQPNKEKLDFLIRLMTIHGINPNVAYRLQDWVDDNHESLPEGAEDNFYLTLDTPYRTGNTALVSTSELRLLNILTPEEFERIVPLVSILPPNAGLNMNTVSAGVVRALGDYISESDANGFVDSRTKKGFSKLNEVLGHPILINRLDKRIEGLLTVNSNYFSVYIKAQYRDMTYYQHSRLARDKDGRVSVISRETGVFPNWVKTLRESVR